MVLRMAGKILSFFKGMGSVIVLLPPTPQADVQLCRPQPAIEDAIGGYWARVGERLQGAMGHARVEQENPTAR